MLVGLPLVIENSNSVTQSITIISGKNRRDAQVGKSICCHILHKVGELGWCVVLSADATSAVKGYFWAFIIKLSILSSDPRVM